MRQRRLKIVSPLGTADAVGNLQFRQEVGWKSTPTKTLGLLRSLSFYNTCKRAWNSVFQMEPLNVPADLFTIFSTNPPNRPLTY